jgi:signal transduction histidine kinase
MLGVLVLLVADGVFLVRREIQILDRDTEVNATHLGLTYGSLLRRVARLDGPDEAVALVQGLNREEYGVRVRWTWLDATAPEHRAPRLDAAALDSVRAGHVISRKEPGVDGVALRRTYVPVSLDPRRPGALEMTESLSSLQSYQRLIVTRAAVFGASAALIGLILSWTVLRVLVGHPLDRMVAQTVAIGAGDFSGRLRIAARGELTDLAQAMNRMCAQLEEARATLLAETRAKIEAVQQLRHTERLAVLGRISSGLAHELGTPLNVVSGRASMIGSQQLSAAEVADRARIIGDQSDRMAGIIRQFLDYARHPSSRRERESLSDLVDDALRLLRPVARASGVELVRGADERPAPLLVDREQMEQVLTNLVVNAIQAMPGGGRVRVSVLRGRGETEDGARILVADDGPGIPPEVLSQIFEPFYTTKESGQGTGLGLSIVKGIVEEHGGRIAVESSAGRGSVFTVDLPDAEPRAEGVNTSNTPHTGGRT